MRVGTALVVALTRSVAAWRAVMLVYLANLGLALVPATLLHGAIAASLGSSLAGERMRTGFDPYWYNSFSAQATGVAATFGPSVAGRGAIFDALEAFVGGFAGLLADPASGLVPLVAAYFLLWSFVSAGFIARFSDAAESRGFMASASRHFPAVLLITVIGLVFFVAMLGPVRSWLDGLRMAALREELDERVVFAWSVAQETATWTAIFVARVVLDYAKVGAVRRSTGSLLRRILGALGLAVRLAWRHPLRIGGLHAGLGIIGVATLVTYVLVVPGMGTASGSAVLWTFLLGQLYILSRVLLRVSFLAGATALSCSLDEVDEEPPATHSAGPSHHKPPTES